MPETADIGRHGTRCRLTQAGFRAHSKAHTPCIMFKNTGLFKKEKKTLRPKVQGELVSRQQFYNLTSRVEYLIAVIPASLIRAAAVAVAIGNDLLTPVAPQ